MRYINYNENFFNNLFLEISERVTELKYRTEERTDNLINRFLDYAVNLAKSDLEDEIIDMELQYEINRICMRKDIDDTAVKCLFIIKSLVYAIVNSECSKILMFAKRYVDNKTYNYLELKLNNVSEEVVSN